jgi:hypothetical protein
MVTRSGFGIDRGVTQTYVGTIIAAGLRGSCLCFVTTFDQPVHIDLLVTFDPRQVSGLSFGPRTRTIGGNSV